MRVAVFGLGKLGAPLAAVLAQAGNEVLGCDVNERFVEAVSHGRAPVEETGLQNLFDDLATSPLLSPMRATLDAEMAAAWAQVSFVVVPTPSQSNGRFSSQYVQQVCAKIGAGWASRARNGVEYPVLVIVSTVMPGTMQSVVIPSLEETSGLRCGGEFGVCYNPEFIALGSVIQDLRRPDFVLIGQSEERAGKALREFYVRAYRTLYGSFTDIPPICVTSLLNAELAKLAVNCYVTMKISYANMVADLCERIPGGDANEVCRIIGYDRRIGKSYLCPATAFGGPCFPRDSLAFIAAAHERALSVPLCQATQLVNDSRHWRLADKILKHKPRRIAILGLSYKPDTAVTEESAGLKLVAAIRKAEQEHYGCEANCKGCEDRPLAEIRLYDPVADVVGRDTHFGKQYTDLDACTAGAEVVVIMVPWKEFSRLSFGGTTVVFDMWRVLDPKRQGELVTLVYPGKNGEEIEEAQDG